VLMLDARKIYRKVTSKVNDFSPEQLRNLICIVNLYRGNAKKFEKTVNDYLQTSANLAQETAKIINSLQACVKVLYNALLQFFEVLAKDNKEAVQFFADFRTQMEGATMVFEQQNKLVKAVTSGLTKKRPTSDILEDIAHQCRLLRKHQDKLIKELIDSIAEAQRQYQLSKNKEWKELNLKAQFEELKKLQQQLSGNITEEEYGLFHDTDYFWKQAHWLASRFPEGAYSDVEGLCKIVTRKEIEDKDWSLSPGRYVGIDAAVDEDFDYEERLNEIHIELDSLNEEAVVLAKKISENYKVLTV